MRKIIAVVLLLASFNMIYAQKESEEKPLKNDFGILELFAGKTLYLNRKYNDTDRSDIIPYIHKNSDLSITIQRNSNGSLRLINKNGSYYYYTIELSKTGGDGEFKIRKKSPVISKVLQADVLQDDSFQFIYGVKGRNVPGVIIRPKEHYEIAGLGLKVSSSNYPYENVDYVTYYETEEEHAKTGEDNRANPRIISIGETARAENSSFRFAAGEHTNINITAKNSGSIGKAYVTLYDIDGNIVREIEGKGTLTLSYIIPEDGFYYISTIVEKGDELEIKLEGE